MQCRVAYGSPAVPVMSVPFALGICARSVKLKVLCSKGASSTVTAMYGSAGSTAEPLAGHFLEDIFSYLTC